MAHGHAASPTGTSPRGTSWSSRPPRAPRCASWISASRRSMDDAHAERSPRPEDTHTHTALLAFSPRWASPEQAGRGRTGPWTDVHALSLLCTAMLTGERPYRGTREALFQEIFSERAPHARGLRRRRRRVGARARARRLAARGAAPARRGDAAARAPGGRLRLGADQRGAGARERARGGDGRGPRGARGGPRMPPRPPRTASPTMGTLAGAAVAALLLVALGITLAAAHTPRSPAPRRRQPRRSPARAARGRRRAARCSSLQAAPRGRRRAAPRALAPGRRRSRGDRGADRVDRRPAAVAESPPPERPEERARPRAERVRASNR
jgi:hypothetical protein